MNEPDQQAAAAWDAMFVESQDRMMRDKGPPQKQRYLIPVIRRIEGWETGWVLAEGISREDAANSVIVEGVRGAVEGDEIAADERGSWGIDVGRLLKILKMERGERR